jgi:hypothetical protein
VRRAVGFALVGFTPLVTAYVSVVSGLVLNVVIDPVAIGTPSLVAWAVALISVLVASIGLAHRAYARVDRWVARAAVLYGAWVVPTAVLAWVIASMMAGISMAAVDGVADRRAIALAALREAALLTAIGHVILLPWVAIAAWVMPGARAAAVTDRADIEA